MNDITTIILTKNEEKNIRNCIESVASISSKIILVDSYSTDNTVKIAEEYPNVEVFFNKFINYGNQFKYALDNIEINTTWVFRLDADEQLTPKSRKELSDLCDIHKNTDINGIIFPLEVTFLGKKLKHGGVYPFKKLCIFKYGHAYMEDRYMDEQLVLIDGKIVEMKEVSLHHDYKDLSFWIEKHNWYATRAAKDYLIRKDEGDAHTNLDLPAKVRRIIKYKIYYKLPSGIRTTLFFIYRYIFRLGFLDGKAGFYYNFFQAYWYRVLVDAKIYESINSGRKIGETGDWSNE